jgi:hypothetical protein
MTIGEQFTIFAFDSDYHNNACLNYGFHNLDLYACGYKLAADSLVESVNKSGKNQDLLIYPIVFLFRQYFELRLKELISEGNKVLNSCSDYEKTHNLERLWEAAFKIIEIIYKDHSGRPYFKLVGDFFAEFSKYDSYSMSFRYPTDREGKNPIENLVYINIRKFAEIANEVSEIIEPLSCGIPDM